MDLSIIIPCHNLEGFIKPLLDSLEKQKETGETEIIFVCDACVDNTKDIIIEWCQKESVKKLYSTKVFTANVKSCGLARNIGIDNSSGIYIWFIDGDDWIIGEDTIEKLLTIVFRDKLDILRFEYASDLFPVSDVYYMMVWQYIIKRELIGKTSFLSIQPDEDKYFMIEILNKISTYPFLREPLYFYNYGRDGSNMQQLRTKGIIEP